MHEEIVTYVKIAEAMITKPTEEGQKSAEASAEKLMEHFADGWELFLATEAMEDDENPAEGWKHLAEFAKNMK